LLHTPALQLSPALELERRSQKIYYALNLSHDCLSSFNVILAQGIK
jgi:hypothetical protein